MITSPTFCPNSVANQSLTTMWCARLTRSLFDFRLNGGGVHCPLNPITRFNGASLNSSRIRCNKSKQLTHLCSFAVSAKYSSSAAAESVSSSTDSSSPPQPMSARARRIARRNSPEGVLTHKLDLCSKNNDLEKALRLYNDACTNGVSLNQHQYNVLLYLCSLSSSSAGDNSSNWSGAEKVDENGVNHGLERGFEIFKQMCRDKITPNEATFTNLARLAVAKEDPEMAFELVKQMESSGISPRLRSYGPALFGFCKKMDADRAYEVEAHMVDCGVVADEPELSALLKVSVERKRPDKVYQLLHKLRVRVRQVSEDTAEVLEEWFTSSASAKIGTDKYDVRKVKEGIAKGGGGWHGQGWLGSGKWKVVRTGMDESGVCRSCGEMLVCIDIDPKETEEFASSLAKLACKNEAKAEFVRFQEWLEKHGPFDAVIDGANVSLVNQRDFNFNQLNYVVNQIRELSPSKKMPLVVLHRARVNSGPAQLPRNKNLLDGWRSSGALYATPARSNDDWYWLYAAVSNKCLLVTNDEMRDHLFQLLGDSFFPRWKEKHQVRLSVSRRGFVINMPPPYTSVIQESEQGSWHVPTITGDDLETPRQWLCASRNQPSPKAQKRSSLSNIFSTK